MDELLIPENELQELWEQNGRVKAVVACLKLGRYISPNIMIAMLTGEVTDIQDDLAHCDADPWDKEDDAV